jgi:hypothetical protein
MRLRSAVLARNRRDVTRQRCEGYGWLVWLRHGTLPDWNRRERNWSLSHRCLQAEPWSVMLNGNS